MPLEARRLIFRQENSLEAPKIEYEDIILELNIVFSEAGLPDFLRIVDTGYTRTETISTILEKGALDQILLSRYLDLLIAAARKIDSTIILLA